MDKKTMKLAWSNALAIVRADESKKVREKKLYPSKNASIILPFHSLDNVNFLQIPVSESGPKIEH